MNPLLQQNNTAKPIGVYLEEWASACKMLVFIVLMRLCEAGPWQWYRRKFQTQTARGETIWLDDLELFQALPPDQHRSSDPALTADITPNRTQKPRKSGAIKLKAYPPPQYPFNYRHPPRSGNIINGLGETQPRPAHKLFHSGNYRIAWGGLERYMHMYASPIATRMVRTVRWLDRHKAGRAATVRYPVNDPQQMAHYVKAAAQHLGAELVGITHLSAEHTFAHFDPSPYPTAISLVVSMEREGLRYVTTPQGTEVIMGAYYRISQAAIELARRIRNLGWDALAASNIGADCDEVLHIPLAVQAGLGQLGKHGSLITQTLGPRVRLATVLTNMPLTHDQPVDIGVDDFCHQCQACTSNCPPQAIFTEKQMVRGVKKWYVDFDKCIPYFSMHHSCGICIAVCPWTEPGQGKAISLKMLAKREHPPHLSAQGPHRAPTPAPINPPISHSDITVHQEQVTPHTI